MTPLREIDQDAMRARLHEIVDQMCDRANVANFFFKCEPEPDGEEVDDLGRRHIKYRRGSVTQLFVQWLDHDEPRD